MSDFPQGMTVLTQPDQLRSFAAAGGELPRAALQPRTTDQIRDAIRWAKRGKRQLVPVSSAQGQRVHGCTEAGPGAIVVDLSAMKRVRHVDALDAIAVIEPGVTFAEFDAQLVNHGLRSYKPLLPRRSKSVIASHLEREPITSPRDQWDAADPLCAVEMVFGTGEMFRTGTAAVEDDLETQIEHGLRQMSSLGPFATDFTRVIMGAQGSLGIVSWASVYCERVPALEKAWFVPCDRLEPLVELSSRIGWRKLAAQCFIVNNVQLALMLGHDADAVWHLAARLPAWVLFVNIAALNYFPEERIEYETEALVEDAGGLGLTIQSSLLGMEADRITRMQQNLPADYYKDRPGLAHDEIFFLSQSDNAPAFIRAFEAIHDRRDSAPGYAVYLQPRVQSSSCHFEFTSFWPDGDRARADFHRDASRALDGSGAFFSRPYGIWKDIAFARDPGIVPHLRRTKEMLDPDSVLNPGKFF